MRPLTSDTIFDIASNGTRIIETIINNKTYKSKSKFFFKSIQVNKYLFLLLGITGSTIKIDKNGDSEGNFSVLALKPHTFVVRENLTCDFTMLPVAYFQEGMILPVSESWF